jgi:hypothetical protein
VIFEGQFVGEQLVHLLAVQGHKLIGLFSVSTPRETSSRIAASGSGSCSSSASVSAGDNK